VAVPLSAVGGVDLTVDPAEPREAAADVAVDTVGARAATLARVAVALVDVVLAPGAPESRRTGAQESVHLVLAAAAVAAGVWAENQESGKRSRVERSAHDQRCR